MGMNASELDRRVQVLRRTEVGRSPLNAPIYEWNNLGKPISARRSDVSDVEKAGIWGVRALLVTRFVIRSTPFARQIRHDDQLLHGGLIFNITGIKEVAQERAFLEVTAQTAGVK